MAQRSRNEIPTITVCVVGNDCLGSLYLELLLKRCPDIRVVRRNESSFAASMPNRADTVFLLYLPEMELPPHRYVRTFRAYAPECPILAIGKRLPSSEQCRLLLFGVNGFVSCDQVEQQLRLAIRAVAGGKAWASAEVLSEYVTYSRAVQSPREPRLTATEVKVLELVKRTLSNKEISDALRISESTVKFHLSNIFSKLGVHDRREAAKWTSFDTSVKAGDEEDIDPTALLTRSR